MVSNKKLLDELRQLSAAERILLAQDLWDSVAEDPNAWEMTPEQARVLDERLRTLEARKACGESAGSSWEDVKHRIQQGE